MMQINHLIKLSLMTQLYSEDTLVYSTNITSIPKCCYREVYNSDYSLLNMKGSKIILGGRYLMQYNDLDLEKGKWNSVDCYFLLLD